MTAIHSRRSMLAALAAAPALSLPAVAAGLDGPDPVIRLCSAFRGIEDKFEADMARSTEIAERVRSEMPLPDPSIVPSAETEALWIKVPEEGCWWSPHNAIEPHFIETALFYVQPVKMRMTEEIMPDGKIARVFIDHDEPAPLSEAQQAEHDKLTRMLELSKQYFEEYNRRLKAAGYNDRDDDDAVDDAIDRQNTIERAIRITPAKTREGLLAKIELYESDPERFGPMETGEGLIGSILRDTRRLFAA